MNILSASQLDAYLDQTEAALEQQIEAELDPELIGAGLKTALESQHFHADTMNGVHRLFRLWMNAVDPAAALRLLDGDGRAALAALPDAERDAWEVSVALWRVEARIAQGDAGAMQAAFDAALALLVSLPDCLAYNRAWAYLDEESALNAAHGATRRCAEARNALQRADPERAAYRAWDDAHLAIRQAQSFAMEGDAALARQAGERAIGILAGAAADQDLDHNDWLRAGHALAWVMPDAIDGIAAQVRAHIPATTVFFARRDIDVRIARLEARALHQQGALDQALEKLALGRVALLADDGDHVGVQMLDWLLEAGRHDAAARLAFESVLHERQVSAPHAAGAAMRAAADGTTHQPYWHLALACAAMADATAEVRGNEDEASFIGRHLALARAQGGAHPAADAVEALWLIASAQDYQRALPLLESAARDPSLMQSQVVFKLIVARMRVHGPEAALAMPFMPASNGLSCYNVAVRLASQLDEVLPKDMAAPEEPVKALSARYYETGLACFEAFVASGRGHPGDGDAHSYSMLCNNLAIYYRYDKSDAAAALALHHKGIVSSPFSEHYQGVLNCHRKLGNDSAVVDSAEQLWHFSADHGYSRHDPANYIDDTAAALHRLGRDTDIAIWLQRLDDWWTSVDDGERAQYRSRYTRALVSVLYYMAQTQPDDASLRLESVLPSVPEAGSPYTSRIAADALCKLGQFERAQAMYRDGLRYIESGDAWHESQRTAILANLEDCKRLQREAKPWWKLW
ncbi:hypothetical protein F2P45_10340 [Massilia sp. CCM 8733]|uniref:Tetratricopeptide repeat protein n=1 Tax=Massilia mucilaginosa TaxID=2609282 RepID=A0ABX0NRK2_9BURK|nr:hypothetical protein [Massilia mucilaginosa]NHZ89411.1 hypothetical protein [Massilia mucilaginosa]